MLAPTRWLVCLGEWVATAAAVPVAHTAVWWGPVQQTWVAANMIVAVLLWWLQPLQNGASTKGETAQGKPLGTTSINHNPPCA